MKSRVGRVLSATSALLLMNPTLSRSSHIEVLRSEAEVRSVSALLSPVWRGLGTHHNVSAKEENWGESSEFPAVW